MCNIAIIEKLQQVEEKISNLDFQRNVENDRKISALENLIVEKNEQLKRFEMEVERKFVIFETSLNTLKKCVREKDLHIEKIAKLRQAAIAI